jgi:hypothetical protein
MAVVKIIDDVLDILIEHPDAANLATLVDPDSSRTLLLQPSNG